MLTSFVPQTSTDEPAQNLDDDFYDDEEESTAEPLSVDAMQEQAYVAPAKLDPPFPLPFRPEYVVPSPQLLTRHLRLQRF